MKRENSGHQAAYAGFVPAVREAGVRRPTFGRMAKAAVTMADVTESAATSRVAAPDHSDSIKA